MLCPEYYILFGTKWLIGCEVPNRDMSTDFISSTPPSA
nr:MAG TPA: hypothetical protein [Caudoviricetes sp.]